MSNGKSVNKGRLSHLQKLAKPLDSKKHTRTHPLSLCRAVSKRSGSVERIHWFLADRRPIRVKKGCGFKNTRMRVDGRKFP